MSCGDRKWAPVVEMHHEASWLCDMSARCLAMLAAAGIVGINNREILLFPVFGARAVIRVLCFRLNGFSKYHYSGKYSMLPRTATRPVDSVGLFGRT